MKKLKTAVSVLSVLGLGAWAAISAPKNYSLTKDTDEKVYMVSVKGDIVNDNAAAVKNRKEVVNELNYKLAGKGYTITHTYDTVYNGFAIKTTANIADIVKSLQGVRSVEEEIIALWFNKGTWKGQSYGLKEVTAFKVLIRSL
jgi:hypothetical protein